MEKYSMLRDTRCGIVAFVFVGQHGSKSFEDRQIVGFLCSLIPCVARVYFHLSLFPPKSASLLRVVVGDNNTSRCFSAGSKENTTQDSKAVMSSKAFFSDMISLYSVSSLNFLISD
jgi:hypothetical protein